MTDFVELKIRSSLDGSAEPSLFFLPDGNGPFPLVVSLHTWSFNRFNLKAQLDYAKKRNFALLLPEFRGPNLNTNPRAREACGSALARQDIADAAEFALKNYPVRPDMVFLLGGSGGAHMGLLAAALRPDLWRAVEVWCPITDVAEWHRYYGSGNGYAPHMEACCGGLPSECPDEYAVRSPIRYLDDLARVRYLSVKHGRYDKSVPYVHTLKLAAALDALKPEAFFFEIFDGGHDSIYVESFALFESICGGRSKKTDRITS
ncbi:MAG: Prolyl oligopeptidase family protein [Lentisphaerae bacterium ADurb.Bin242]|nr:MAG: Prolyl oligopeptidase family protein [Lentisphaerae bacterium ADurb.Bin242]